MLLATFGAYCAWAYLVDGSLSRGGVKARLRRSPVLAGIARYFDVEITIAGGAKTCGKDDCDDDNGERGNSIFCYHPHGVIFWGVVAGFMYQGRRGRAQEGEKEMFMGKSLAAHDIALGTISLNNLVPLFREVNKHLGSCDVSWRSCNEALKVSPCLLENCLWKAKTKNSAD